MIAVQYGHRIFVLDDPAIRPDYAIGDRVCKYHQAKILTVDGLDNRSGNRPMYHFAEVRGWYSETCLERVEG